MSQYYSAGLESIFCEIAEQNHRRILDLGVITSGSFQLFSPHCKKFHYEDAHDYFSSGELKLNALIASVSEVLPQNEKEGALKVVLCWDILNFLPEKSVIKFFDFLTPYFCEDTLVHAIFYVGQDVPIHPGRFLLARQGGFKQAVRTPNRTGETRDSGQSGTFDIRFATPKSAARKIPALKTASLLKQLPEFYIHNTLLAGESDIVGLTEKVFRFRPDRMALPRREKAIEFRRRKRSLKADLSRQAFSPATQWIFAYLQGISSSTRLLDLGCNPENSVLWRRHCADVRHVNLYASMRWRHRQAKKPHASNGTKNPFMSSNSNAFPPPSDGDDPIRQIINPEALKFGKGVTFDVIVFWDILNHFSHQQIRAIGHHLSQYCHQETKIVVMLYSGENVPQKPLKLLLSDGGNLHYDEEKRAPRQQEALPMAGLTRLVPQFSMQESFFLKPKMLQGVSEIILKFKGDGNPSRVLEKPEYSAV